MTTETHPITRNRRNPWLRRGLLIVVSLIVAAVLWDGIHAAITPPKRGNFSATTMDGKDWSLASYRGKKPVILSFFATWCGPCKLELPHLIELREKYRDRGVELVIITRETPEVVRQSPEFLKMPVTLITDGSDIFDEYRVDGIPHTFMFDRTGKVVFDLEGYQEGALADLEKRLEASERS